MCLAPLSIPNPNYHAKVSPEFAKYHNVDDKMIDVPCGVCSECVARRQLDMVNRTRMESIDNHFFFCTLTYNPESLPSVACSNGWSVPYADVSDVRNMFKRLRKSNALGRPFRYFAVSERGSERGRPHFHLLILMPKYPDDDTHKCLNLERVLYRNVLSEWRRNYGSTRNPVWRPLCTFRKVWKNGKLFRNYDLHYVNPCMSDNGVSDVGFYISKYMLKESKQERRLQSALRLNLPFEEFSDIWSLVRSRVFHSLDFGCSTFEQVSLVGESIEYSKNDKDGLKIRDPIDGHLFPMPRYYKKFLSVDAYNSSVAARGGPYAVRPEVRSAEYRKNRWSKASATYSRALLRDESFV